MQAVHSLHRKIQHPKGCFFFCLNAEMCRKVTNSRHYVEEQAFGGESLNKHFLKHYMTTEPQTMEQKYIFLVDNENLAMNIVASEYQAIALISGGEAYYSVYSFIEYMEEIAFAGTYRSDYCYIPASSVKKSNDTLEVYFKQEYLQFHTGWMLFKNKDYLQKIENQAELKEILSGFLLRFEGKLTE